MAGIDSKVFANLGNPNAAIIMKAIEAGSVTGLINPCTNPINRSTNMNHWAFPSRT